MRGEAAEKREGMVKGSDEYKAACKVVHCKNTDPDCQNTVNYENTKK